MKKNLCLLSLLIGTVAFAQQSEENIEEVTLQGKFLSLPYKKVNENVVVILKKDIEMAAATSIDEILQQISGVDIQRRGSNGVQSDISIRGGSFEQAMILINGVRMNDSQTGHNSLHIPVELSNVERIEVIKGPAARRFGNNAYSGVINIITKTSSEESVKISATGGDFSTYSIGLDATFGSGNFSNMFQINSGSSQGYRHNTDYDIRNVFYQSQYSLNNGKLQFQAGFSEKKFGANGFYASSLATEQYEEVQASVISLSHRQNFGKFNLNSQVYWRRGQDMYLFNREKPEIYRNMHIGNNVGGEVNATYTSQLGTTGLGVELRKEFLKSNNLGDRERFVNQLFLEHHVLLFQNKLQLSPGISWANISNAGNFFYPGLDIGFDFSNHHKLFANITKVHRIPTFTDLYYVSKTEIGNPDLTPESALSYELGYRFLKNRMLAQASFFHRKTENGIDWVKNDEAGQWRAENIGNIDTKGFEAEISKKYDGFVKSWSVGYTFIDNKLTQQTEFSKYAMDFLKHQLVAKVENRFFGKFSNQLSYRYQERANNYSYHLLDEKLMYNLDDLKVYLLINNLTNKQYKEAFGVPMPGRWFHVGFSYTIK